SDSEFERLAVQHSERAWKYAFTFLNDSAAADDLVQEAIVRLYEKRAAYPLRTKFGPYLVKTVARLAIDMQRDRRVEQRNAPIREQAKTHSSTSDPAMNVQKIEAHQALSRALAQLPQTERACLL